MSERRLGPHKSSDCYEYAKKFENTWLTVAHIYFDSEGMIDGAEIHDDAITRDWVFIPRENMDDFMLDSCEELVREYMDSDDYKSRFVNDEEAV